MRQDVHIPLAKTGIVMCVSIYMYTHTQAPKSPFLQLRIF